MSEEQRIPPHNQEAECQLLGAILINNDTLNRVAGFLEPRHFALQQHQEIYEKILELVQSGKTASPITLKTFFPPETQWNGLSVTKYLLNLASDAASAIVAEDYGEAIRDLAIRRQIISLSESMSETAYAAAINTPASMIIDEIGGQLTEIRPTDKNQLSGDTMGQIGEEYLEKLTEVMQGGGEEIPGTGFADIDRHLGGLFRSCAYVIAGRPGMGKTAIAVASMNRIAQQRKRDKSTFGVVYFSLEVPAQDIWARAVSCLLKQRRGIEIPYSEIRRKKGLTADQAEHIAIAAEWLRKLPIRIIDNRGLTVGQIEGRARAIKSKWERHGQTLDVLIVDHIGHVRPTGRYNGNKTAEVTEISNSLLALSERLDVAVLELSQLSRAVENREGCRPQLADLRESGSIEQDANSVILLRRPEYYAQRDGMPVQLADQNRLEAIVAKARDGFTGSVDLHCAIECNFIDNKAR